MNAARPFLLATCCSALPALAGPPIPSAAAATSIGRLFLGLGLVIALVFALAWAAKRVSALRMLGSAADGPIKLVGQLALGTRERLLLVEIDGRRVLLGVVPGAITRLDAPAEAADPEGGFPGRLAAAKRGGA